MEDSTEGSADSMDVSLEDREHFRGPDDVVDDTSGFKLSERSSGTER